MKIYIIVIIAITVGFIARNIYEKRKERKERKE